MADQRGTLELLSDELGSALVAIDEVLRVDHLGDLFLELGLDDPPDVGGDPQFVQKLADAGAQCAALAAALDDLAGAADQGDAAEILGAVGGVLEAIARLVADLDAVATDLKRATAGSPDAAAIAAFAEQMVERLLEAAVVRYLEDAHPVIERILALLALVEVTPLPPGPPPPPPPPDNDGATVVLDDVQVVPLARRRLYLDRLAQLVGDPLDFARAAYGWGDESFDGGRLLLRISDLVAALGPFTLVDEDVAPPSLSALVCYLRPTTEVHPPGLEGGLAVDLAAGTGLTLARLGDEWTLRLALTGRLAAGLSVQILPPASISIVPPAGTLAGEVRLALVGQSATPDQPFVLFGETGGSRLEARQVSAAVLAGLRWDAAGGRAAGELGFEANVALGKLVIDTSSSDGFLQRILPSDGLVADFDFDLGWTAERGFFFTGSAGLELAFALGATLGPFHLDTVHLIVAAGTDGLRLEASVDGGGVIGPVAASVERIGVELALAFARGNLGPVDLGVGFKPPVGLGLRIDAGPITGGGFVEYDPPSGRYAGVLALSLYSIEVTAIGLLDTKLPNGAPGFSLLIIISVELTPIQLGFGFTLNGVGGLCGINRDFVTEALQAGLRQHSLDHILFPKDPVANAPAILSDLRAIFPPAEGRHVFGPMLKIGWGGGLNLLTAELGVLLALPSPVVIAVLGQIDVNLPSPDAAIVELHLDVLGIIDFGKKLFSLDASLHDSRIVAFTILGDMAMRLSWGDPPSFALSIGGLNPHFQPPPGFPTLRRLTLALSASEELRLTIQTYLAITSNTFQLGARAELYLGVGSFNVYGWLGFDALLIFKPFSFVVDFTAGLALRSNGSTLLGISLEGTLSGPTPWHVTGEAHVTLLFFEIGVHADITWGEARRIEAPPTDVWPELRAAIANPQSWSGALPAAVPSVATLARPVGDTGATVLVDPSAALTMRERVCPLDQVLTKFGEAVPGPQNLFRLDPDSVSLGGQAVPFTVVRDQFAPAQFEEMSDQDRLSRPSFEDRDAGFAVGEGLVAFGGQLGMDVAFEDVYVDDKAPPPPARPPRYAPSRAQQLAWARGNAAARAAIRAARVGKFAPPADAPQLVTLADEVFVVATTAELAARHDITHPTTKGEAYQALAAHLLTHPADRELLQVVPVHELAA